MRFVVSMAVSPKPTVVLVHYLLLVIFIAGSMTSLVYCSSSDDHHQYHQQSTAQKHVGFSSKLIHRDHPQSPLHNPELTRWERVEASVERSLSRMNSLAKTIQQTWKPKDMISSVWPEAEGEYFMMYSIGTPPVTAFGLIDTGSSWTWQQCLPCLSEPKVCAEPGIIFDPSKSSSFQVPSCKGELCKLLSRMAPPLMFSCSGFFGGTCEFSLEYLNSATSKGDMVMDFFQFDNYQQSVRFKMAFGCAHYNDFKTASVKLPGVVGLDKGNVSFLSILGIDQFSYCFVPHDVYPYFSVIRFGTRAIFHGVSTPILEGMSSEFYLLQLDSISVGHKWVLPEGYTFDVTESGTRGFIIDSGATHTVLEEQAYEAVVGAMTNAIKDNGLRTCNDTRIKFRPCYCSITMDVLEGITPTLTFHFKGLDLRIEKYNAWITGEGKTCLALLNAGKDKLSIFGNRFQRNMNVGYNLHRKEISFKAANCSTSPYS